MLPNAGVYIQLQTFRIKTNLSIPPARLAKTCALWGLAADTLFDDGWPIIRKRARGFSPKPECSFGDVLKATATLGAIAAEPGAPLPNELLAILRGGDWVPFLTWHHLEELISHGSDEVFRSRVDLLSRLPHLAYVLHVGYQPGLRLRMSNDPFCSISHL